MPPRCTAFHVPFESAIVDTECAAKHPTQCPAQLATIGRAHNAAVETAQCCPFDAAQCEANCSTEFSAICRPYVPTIEFAEQSTEFSSICRTYVTTFVSTECATYLPTQFSALWHSFGTAELAPHNAAFCATFHATIRCAHESVYTLLRTVKSAY